MFYTKWENKAMNRCIFILMLFVLFSLAFSEEYIYNGRFLGMEYRADLHRQKVQPYWQTYRTAYGAFRLVKDVEADVAQSYLNVKSLKEPKEGYKTLWLATDFVAIPHAPVRIQFRARGKGRIEAHVYEYVLEENGKNGWLGQAVELKPQRLTREWKDFIMNYTPRSGELGLVRLRFQFLPDGDDSLDIDLGEVSAVGEPVSRAALPSKLVIPRLTEEPDINNPRSWRGALHLGGFKNNSTGLPDNGLMEIMTGHDGRFIYVGFLSETGEEPVAKFTGHDTTVFRDDSAEVVFTDMEDQAFAQFIINPLNGVYDVNQRDGDPNQWNPPFRSAAGKDATSWWGALAIPIDEIPMQMKGEKSFKINFLQTDITNKGGGTQKLYSAWSHACEPTSRVTVRNTALFPVARLAANSISAGVAPLSSGELELTLVNPGQDSIVYCEYGSTAAHRGTVRVAAPAGTRRFKIPYQPDNELALIVVRDSSGNEIYRHAENYQYRLENHLGMRCYYPLNFIELTSDIASIPEYTLEWELAGAAKGAFPVKGKAERMRIDVSSLPMEKPVPLKVTIRGASGNSMGSRQFTINRPKEEPWHNSTLGITDNPLPPFTPIRQEKDGLFFLQTGMEFNGRALPSAVTSQGHHLLGGPVTMLMDNQDIARAPRKITSVKPNRIEWTAENESCRWTGWAEEDGFTWYTVTLKKNPVAKVSSLYLEIPMKPEYAKLLNPYPFFRSGGDMDGRWNFDGTPWTSLDFKHIITLRNEYRGIELTSEDERDCSRASSSGSHRVFMRGKDAIIRLTFIDKPTPLTRERTFCFGIQAFPAKPLVRHPGYMGTSCHIDPRTAAYSGSMDKAQLVIGKLKSAKQEGTLEWSAYWDFEPQRIHPDYHVRPFFSQVLAAIGECRLNYLPDKGFRLVQNKKELESTLPKPAVTKGWHTVSVTWKDCDVRLWLDGQAAAAFQTPQPFARVTKVVFGKSTMAAHSDFHYEAVKLSATALPPEKLGNFSKTPGTLFLKNFAGDTQESVQFLGEVRQVKTDRGILPSTSAEHFTRLDTLQDAGFRSYKGYLNRLFQFYGPKPNGYRNQPYTNDEGYKATGILMSDLAARGLTAYFGYSFGVRVDSREDKLYRDFFSIEPAALYGAPTTGFWHMCAGCREYNDFLLYYFNDLMNRYENLGIYTDNTFICGRICKNEAHGCGYHDLDAGGVLKPGGNILKGRAFAKRLYAITKLRPIPREHFMHSSGENHAIYLSWADKYLCGEQYLENKDRIGWNIDLSQFRAQNDITRAFGVPAVVIPTFVPFRHKGMIAVAGLHDCATYGGQMLQYPKDIIAYRPFLQAVNRFRTWEADFIPYYDNQGIVTTDQAKRHYASLWRKPGQILLQMSNLTWEKADVTATLDLKALGLKGKFTDAITGESVPCQNGRITLNIPDYDFRLIIGE